MQSRLTPAARPKAVRKTTPKRTKTPPKSPSFAPALVTGFSSPSSTPAPLSPRPEFTTTPDRYQQGQSPAPSSGTRRVSPPRNEKQKLFLDPSFYVDALKTTSVAELQKQLTAATAYNRFMEKRVKQLERQLTHIGFHRQRISSQHGLSGDGGDTAVADGGVDGLNSDRDTTPVSPTSPTAAGSVSFEGKAPQSLIDENIQFASTAKKQKAVVEQLKEQLKLTQVNLDHARQVDREKNLRIKRLMDELKEVKELMPQGLLYGADGKSVAGSVSFYGGGLAGIGVSGSDAGGDGETIVGDPDDRPEDGEEADEPPPPPPPETEYTAIFDDGLDEDATAEQHEELAALDEPWRETDGLFDPRFVKSYGERSKMLEERCKRTRRMLAYSKKRLEPTTDPTIPAHKRRDLNVAIATKAIHRAMEAVDDTANRLKQIPLDVQAFQAKQRSGITMLVECQNMNGKLTPSVASRISVAVAELTRLDEAVHEGAEAVSMDVPRLMTLILDVASISMGIGLYKPHSHLAYFVSQVESHVERMVGFDQTFIQPSLPQKGSVESALAGAAETREPPKLGISELKTMSSANNAMVQRVHMLAEGVEFLGTVRGTLQSLSRVLNGEMMVTANNEELGVKHCGVQVQLTKKYTAEEMRLSKLAEIRYPYYDCVKDVPMQTRHRSTSRNASSRRNRTVTPRGLRERIEDDEEDGVGATPGGDGAQASVGEAGASSPGAGPARTATPIRVNYSSLAKSEVIDRLLKEQLAAGVPVPPNFGRIHGAGSRFRFGSKAINIDVSGVKDLVVHTGGGYFTFREYCAKYTPVETKRVEVRERVTSRKEGGGNAEHASVMAGFRSLDDFLGAVATVEAARAERRSTVQFGDESDEEFLDDN